MVGRHAVMVLPFQSTRPARGATPTWRNCILTTGISIHAPREGRDIKQRQKKQE